MTRSNIRLSLHDQINRQIANFGVLYIKLHHYHWFVKGSAFFELHAKFEELYTEASAHMDELAERLLAIHGKPAASLKDFLELASIEEAAGPESAEQMAQNLVNDYNTIRDQLKEGLQAAEAEDDDATADLFTEIRRSIEKHAWMLNAFIGK